MFRIQGEQSIMKSHKPGYLTTCGPTGAYPKPALFLETGQGVMWVQEIKRSNRFIWLNETGVDANRYMGYGTSNPDPSDSDPQILVDFWIVETSWKTEFSDDARKERERRANILKNHVNQCNIYKDERERKRDRFMRAGTRSGQSAKNLLAAPVILTAAIGSFVGGAIVGAVRGPLYGGSVSFERTYEQIVPDWVNDDELTEHIPFAVQALGLHAAGVTAGAVAATAGAAAGAVAGPPIDAVNHAYQGGKATKDFFYGDQQKTDKERDDKMNVKMNAPTRFF